MGKFLDWLFNVSSDDAAIAVAGMRAQPLVVRTGDQPTPTEEKVRHAKWRLDAIKRTIEQDAKGILTSQHYDEFRTEIRDLAHTLVQAGVILDEDALALIRHGKGATL